MNKLDRAVKKRTGQIFRTFKKNGLSPLSQIKKLKNLLDGKKLSFTDDEARRVRLSFEDLGPAFIKLGQMLSTHRDLIPNNLLEELEKLQDRARPISFEEVNSVFIEEFSQGLDQIYDDFDKEPLASASIAQVHKARMGDEVLCVKIQRPGIKDIVKIDIEVLSRLASFLQKNSRLADNFNFEKIVQNFGRSLMDELDFTKERNNLEEFYKNHELDKYVSCPRTYKNLSTDKILTMEYIDGLSMKEAYFLPLDQKDKISKRLLYSYANQVFKDGFFHTDPHPGNIIVKDQDHIFFIDFGQVGRFTSSFRYYILQMFLGVTLSNTRIISQALFKLGVLIPGEIDVDKFEHSIDYLVLLYKGVEIHDISLKGIIEDFFHLLDDYNIEVPAEFTLLGKTLILLEGVLLELNPESSFVELAEPLAKKMLLRFFSLDYVKEKAINYAFDSYVLMEELPYQLRKKIEGIDRSKNLIEDEEKEARDKNMGPILISISLFLLSLLFIYNLNFGLTRELLIFLISVFSILFVIVLLKFMRN